MKVLVSFKSRKRDDESTSFSNNLMKRQNFRASHGGGSFVQIRIKSREHYTESSAFSHNLMKLQSFRASRENWKLNSDK